MKFTEYYTEVDDIRDKSVGLSELSKQHRLVLIKTKLKEKTQFLESGKGITYKIHLLNFS